MQITGPAGSLEAQLDLAPKEQTKTAILCHPHPQYGGSMHDAVLKTAAEVLLERGVNCLRFNFRGVGNSEGSFDQGNGEMADLLAVAGWVSEEYPRDELWLVGYSFGAAVSWRALSHCKPALTLLIAPPVGMMPFTTHASLPGNVLAVAGDQDEFVDQSTFNNWADVTTHTLAGADHFFSASHPELAALLAELVK